MKLKHLFKEIDERLLGREFPLMSVSKIKGVVSRAELADDEGRALSIENYKLCQPGDLVINRMAAYQGALGIAFVAGAVSPDYTILRGPAELTRFLYFFLKSSLGLALVTSLLKGIGSVDSGSVRTPRLNWRDLGDIEMLIAPVGELSKATDLLEKQTLQIDRLIFKKEQLIEKLLERRQALITHVVTKGFETRHELLVGADWSGAVPASWKVEKASRLFRARKGSQAGKLSVDYCASHIGDFPVYSGQTENQGIMAKIDSFEFDFGKRSVLLTTTVGSSKVMSVKQISGRFSLSQNCMILENISESELHNSYAYWMVTAAFNYKKLQLEAHMQNSFRMADFYSYRLLVPPLEEQVKISTHLENESRQIDILIDRTRKAIQLLKERRQALITQVVTGKIDVRGFAGGNS